MNATPSDTPLDLLIVGTGFAGLAMAIRYKTAGLGSFLLLEEAQDVGGTWRDNTYPGCACDIPSHLYSLSFEPKADWTRMYPSQPEIQAYLREVADRHDLRAHTRFGARMRSAAWDEAAGLWRVTTENGAAFSARVLVSALGALHVPSIPQTPGIEAFQGAVFHSAQWDHGYDLAGKRVAVIGTGASAIQFVPQIAPKVESLTLFQRTPPWVMPKRDRPISPFERWLFKVFPPARMALRRSLFWMHELRRLVFGAENRLARTAQKLARKHIEDHIRDPELRRKVTPDYRLGCKRVLIANDYYPALARPNVSVLTDGVAEVREGSVVTRSGEELPVDAIIFGTGFHTTDALSSLDIRGRDGRLLGEAWTGGMEANLGVSVAGFPNLFFLLGPNTGLAHNSVVLMIEAQVGYVMRMLKAMKRDRIARVEVHPQVQAGFTREIQDRLDKAVWQTGGCQSWYLDANGRNTTLWPGSVPEYERRTRTAPLSDFIQTAS